MGLKHTDGVILCTQGNMAVQLLNSFREHNKLPEYHEYIEIIFSAWLVIHCDESTGVYDQNHTWRAFTSCCYVFLLKC